MTVTWDNVGGGGTNLLPEGTRNYEITLARPEVNERTKRREARIGLTSSSGSGETTVPLESWGDDDLFLRIFGGAAKGLGYRPTRADFEQNPSILPVDVDEFSRYVSTLIGAVVEVKVDHVESKTIKDDGTPFINHRTYFNKVVMRNDSHAAVAQATTTAVPVGAGYASDEDIPF